ncbi:MAG: AMP-binding protein [Candidatus Cloacimonetes bacterium]|nr:AMP-binding protein [Candidatus Cloacimonadota bacterium]
MEKLTLRSAFEETVKKWPFRPSLSWADDQPMNYAELAEAVSNLSLFLRKLGIHKGDRVAIVSENCPNWGIAYLAITTYGAIVVPILPEFHASEIQHILRHSGASALFVSQRYYDRIEDTSFDILKTLILMNDFSIIPPETSKEKLNSILESGRREFNRLTNSALQFAGLISTELNEDDVAAIVYTSGTTGHSKGVMLTHRNLVFNALDTLKIQTIVHTDRLLSVLPLPHTYECTIGFIIPMITGASIYYLKKPPTSRVLLPAMQKIKPTVILTVPLIIEKTFKTRVYPALTGSVAGKILYSIPFIRKILHRIAGRKLMHSFGGNLHFFGIGGAMLCPEVERFLRDAKFPYAVGYGLTETSPLIAGCSPDVTKYRATGTILPGLDVKIINPDDKGEGEIVVKGDSVMKGYYKDAAQTREVFTPDGYFLTGDLGIIRKNYLFIRGRLKNVIIGPSGENIYPEEIETAINESENVLESLVFSREKRIIARIYLNYEFFDQEQKKHHYNSTQMQDKINKALDDIKKNVNQRVSSFSRISVVIEQAEPFEKTPTQKIKRYLYTE